MIARPSHRAIVVLLLVTGFIVAPCAVGAQPSGKVFQIGILSNVPLSDPDGARVWGAFLQGLRDLGYVEGKNIAIVHRSTEGRYQRLPDLATELVRLKVDVIVVPTTQGATAVKQVSSTVPIVIANAGDPIGTGLVASLARPGGNVTGVSTLAPEIVGKQLALLKEMAPKLTRVAALGNPTNTAFEPWLRQAQAAARSLRLSLQVVEARVPEDLEKAFAAMTREHAGAVFVVGDAMFLLHRTRIVELAAKHRLPAMYGLKELAEPGGLVTYAPSMEDGFRRAASYVDKIFKGAKPADLPVEQPTKFYLVINVKTAKALGLTIPQSVVTRADEVIQ